MNDLILKACETGGFAFQRAFVVCLRAVVTRRRPDCNEEQAQFWMSVATEAQKKEAFDDANQVLSAITAENTE